MIVNFVNAVPAVSHRFAMRPMNSDYQTIFSLPAPDSNNKSEIQVRILSISDLDTQEISAWDDLERNAISSTPYLSRIFVEAAVAAQLGQREPIFIVVEQDNQWIGMGIFESVTATRTIPVPHLRSWRTNHTYLDGMLIRREEGPSALHAFWEFIKHEVHPWYAVEFRQLAIDDPATKQIEQAATKADIDFKKGQVKSRASVDLSSASVNNQESNGISKRRARSLRQGWNWLSKQGEVSFRLQRNSNKVKQSALRFLELEAMGWKSKAGTALASHESERDFFLDLVERFARQDRVFFLELLIDETVIASVVHFAAGNVSYAFKLGWDPNLSRGCPGFQLKAQTLFQAQQLLPHMKIIDSCACPGSFIEHIWADRREIAPHIFLTSRVAHIACSMLGSIKWIRDRGCQFFHLTRGQHDADC